MGDSGSYFLGYIIASLSIMGSMRSQTTVAILIPVIALGVPIFDVICAPIRRFITGQNLFSPDKDHLHHRLLKMGFTHRNVVLILYIITILLGMVALILVYLQTDFIGILLGLLALGVILGVRKIGYLEYITVDKFFGWFSDISDELGLCRHRRTFLGLQMNLYESKTITEFRENLIKACMFLKLDYLKISLEHHDAGDGEGSLPLIWKSDNYNSIADALSSPQNFYITLPLRCPQANQGYIALARLKNCEDLEPYILRRIEHLRRSVESTLMSILQQSASEQEATAEIFSGGDWSAFKTKKYIFSWEKLMKRGLITGITGQDGSYLAELLLAKGYEVHGLIRRASTFNTNRIEHLYVDSHDPQARLFLHYGDLNDSGQLTNLIYNLQPQEIYHLGAQSHVRVSFDIPEYTGDISGLGATRLLEAVRRSGIQTRFYQASSSELFGDAPPPQHEETHMRPRSPYAAAKLYAYWMVRNYREAYGLFAVNGILFNHESPRRGETFVTRKITRAAARIKMGLQKKLYLGNLEARRDWGYAAGIC